LSDSGPFRFRRVAGTPVALIWDPALSNGRRAVERVEFGGMKLEEIERETDKLSEEERACLASRLLRSLESPVYEVSDEEVERRQREAEADPSVWMTFEELVAGLKNRGA